MDYFPFTVDASGAAFRIPAAGQYIRYLSVSAGIISPQIEVSGDRAGRVLLLPGQDALMAEANQEWTINNPGDVDIEGMLVIGEKNERLTDGRVQGDVSIIDGGKARTLADEAFIFNAYAAGVAAEYSHLQLWNPVDSGERFIVKSFNAYSSSAGYLRLHRHDAALAQDVSGGVVSKNFKASPGTCAALGKYDQLAAIVGDVIKNFICEANIYYHEVLQEPIVIHPGYGLIAIAETANIPIGFSCEFTKEANA